MTVQMPIEEDSGNAIALKPPFVIDGSDPLCRDVHPGDRYWALPKDYEQEKAEDVGKALILSGDTPLFWIGKDGRFHLNIIPEWSEIARSSAWPALTANIVSEAQNRKEGPVQTLYAIGDSLHFRYPPPTVISSARTTLLRSAAYFEGKFIPLHGVYRLPSYTGLYTSALEETFLIEEKEEKKTREWPISVALVPAGAGDTQALSEKETIATIDAPFWTDVHNGVFDWTWLCLLAALAVLFISKRLTRVR
jgi:hypothetical protein